MWKNRIQKEMKKNIGREISEHALKEKCNFKKYNNDWLFGFLKKTDFKECT